MNQSNEVILKKGMVVEHNGKPCEVVNVSKWNVPNTREASQVKAYPPTKFNEVAIYNDELGLVKLYL
jgi:hypothetical protein